MAKQTELNGVQISRVPAVTRAAREYLRAKEERMALSVVEVDRKKKLLATMIKHNIPTYRCDGVECVMVEGEPNVKARMLTSDPDEE